MKKICLSLIAIVFAINFSYAQWTTSGTVTSTSNTVGIGTSTPAATLDVVGNIGIPSGNIFGRTNLSINQYTDVSNYFFYGLERIANSGRFSGMKVYNIQNVAGYPASRIGFQTDNTQFSYSTEWMTINEWGSVGINTTAPIGQLDVKLGTNQHVNFVGNVNGAYSGTPGIVSINDANTGYTPLGFYASSYYFGNGNVGIGTTSPLSPLHVNGDIRISAGSGGQLIFADGSTMSSASLGSASSLSNTTDAIITSDSGGGGTGDVIFKSTSTERMRVLNSNGNVGIGTSTPGAKLDVNGAVNTSGNITLSTPNSQLIGGGSTWINVPYGLYLSGGTTYFQTQAQIRAGIHNDSAPYLQVDGGTSGYTYFAGNAGIGTTSPATKLDILTSGTQLAVGDPFGSAANFASATPSGQASMLSLVGNDAVAANIGGVLGFGGNYNGANYANWASIKGLKADGTSGNYGGYLSFFTRQTGAGSIERMRITDAGNVGVGTTSPTSNLQIGTTAGTSTSSPVTLSLGGTYSSTHGINPKLKVYDDGTNFWGLGISADQLDYMVSGSPYDHVFYAGGAELMRIKGNGNVGIGTTTPDQLLSVNGNIHAQEVLVNLTGFEDRVFKKTYHLPTLPEVKEYIDKNHHLPDVPSESEVMKNGLKLGDMGRTLTKKVEELTLYLIEKDRQITQQQATNQTLQHEIDELKKQVSNLIKPKK